MSLPHGRKGFASLAHPDQAGDRDTGSGYAPSGARRQAQWRVLPGAIQAGRACPGRVCGPETVAEYRPRAGMGAIVRFQRTACQ